MLICPKYFDCQLPEPKGLGFLENLMKIPSRLLPLLHAELIHEVVGQLQSGKEAEVYLVRSAGEYRCAKVYKESNNRSFQQKTQYTEGRKVRGSRRGRAMESKSRYGREERETAWHSTEVDTLILLGQAGIRVPKTYVYYEGVLLLQLITDADGNPAPRLNDVKLTAEQARTFYAELMREAVALLCEGIVHGDLSEFNVLLSKDGLVIIDFPQAVQATSNTAWAIFERDLLTLRAFFGRFAPELLTTNYAKEIWNIYKNGKLRHDTPLTGRFEESTKKVDIEAVFVEIEEARQEAMERRNLDS